MVNIFSRWILYPEKKIMSQYSLRYCALKLFIQMEGYQKNQALLFLSLFDINNQFEKKSHLFFIA